MACIITRRIVFNIHPGRLTWAEEGYPDQGKVLWHYGLSYLRVPMLKYERTRSRLTLVGSIAPFPRELDTTTANFFFWGGGGQQSLSLLFTSSPMFSVLNMTCMVGKGT